MGNEQSATGIAAEEQPVRGRASVDATFLRQVRSATSSPRVSVAGSRLIHKTSEVAIPTTPSFRQHRFSQDNTDTKLTTPRAKLSLTEEMGNAQSRRFSRAGIHLENAANGPNDAQFGLAETLKLTQYQIQLLQSTWFRLKMQNTVFTQVFKLLCFKSPVCREMFQKMSIVEGFRSHQCCDMANHAKILTDLVDSLMGDLHQPAKLVQARCMEIGAQHVATYDKCLGSMWDMLGESLTEVITKIDCVRSKREAVKAWISLLSYLVDGMKCGYMDEWRRKRLSNGAAAGAID